MIEYIDKKPYFVRSNKFKTYLPHLECPTTLDRWRRFDFKPMSNRLQKRFHRYALAFISSSKKHIYLPSNVRKLS